MEEACGLLQQNLLEKIHHGLLQVGDGGRSCVAATDPRRGRGQLNSARATDGEEDVSDIVRESQSGVSVTGL